MTMRRLHYIVSFWQNCPLIWWIWLYEISWILQLLYLILRPNLPHILNLPPSQPIVLHRFVQGIFENPHGLVGPHCLQQQWWSPGGVSPQGPSWPLSSVQHRGPSSEGTGMSKQYKLQAGLSWGSVQAKTVRLQRQS